MLARPPAKAISLPLTYIFRPAHITFSIPLKHLYHSIYRGNHTTHLTAPKI